MNSEDIARRLKKTTARIEELNAEMALNKQELEERRKEKILLERSLRQAVRIEEEFQRKMSLLENELNGSGEKEDVNAEDH